MGNLTPKKSQFDNGNSPIDPECRRITYGATGEWLIPYRSWVIGKILESILNPSSINTSKAQQFERPMEKLGERNTVTGAPITFSMTVFPKRASLRKAVGLWQ